MKFNKLVLATAIAAMPAAAFSLTEMQDEILSSVTGQDGISINIATPAITTDIIIHDKTGIDGYVGDGTALTPASGSAPITVNNNPAGIGYYVPGPHASGAAPIAYNYSNAGAIVIENFSFSGSLDIDIDAGDAVQSGGTAGTPTLNIAVSLGASTIQTGGISVANSQRDGAASGWDFEAGTQTATILESVTIALSGASLNIQLGNEPQGHMIALDTTLTGGLTMSNLALNDAGGPYTGGSLGAASVYLKNSGDANLDLAAGIDAINTGLRLEISQLGDGGGMDVRVTDAYLGNAGSIVGDVAVKNLSLAGTVVTISGK